MTSISVQERIERTKAFYAMSNAEGPLVGFFTDTYYPLRRYRTESHLPSGRYGPEALAVERFLGQYERLYRDYDALGGELFWSAAAFWGVPWLEAMAGCAIVADQATGSSRSQPPERPPAAEDIPEFDARDPWCAKAREFLVALGRLSAGRFPLATTLMRGITDLMAALYGSPQFIFRLMDSPQESIRVAEKLARLTIGFADSQLELIPDFHGGVGSFYYNLWMPGKGVWLQEDAAALISPELFESVVLPSLANIVEHFDSSIIHLHPSDFIPVDFLIGTELTAIELHIDFGGPRAEELYPYYRKIQSRKPLIIWGDLTREDLDFVTRRLDPQALAVIPVVGSKSEAEEIWRGVKGDR
ncbi:MAG: hypothetical protein JW820_02090 [Spirochaetales bacterium]|nr:hypothetical protein [Spirochaetales bacterium]